MLTRSDFKVNVLLRFVRSGKGWIGPLHVAPRDTVQKATKMKWKPFFGTSDYLDIKQKIEEIFFSTPLSLASLVFAKYDAKATVVATITDKTITITPIFSNNQRLLNRHLSVVAWYLRRLATCLRCKDLKVVVNPVVVSDKLSLEDCNTFKQSTLA